MTDQTIEEWLNSFPPLDIEHATEAEILHMRMMGLTRDEEKRMRMRATELGLMHPIEKPKDK